MQVATTTFGKLADAASFPFQWMLLAFAALVLIRSWASRPSREVTAGWSTLAIVLVALAIDGALTSWHEKITAWVGLLIGVAVLSIAMYAASSQWTRTPLRLAGGTGVLLLLVLLAVVGREHSGAKQADADLVELARIDKSVSALDEPARARPESLAKGAETAMQGLDEALAAYPSRSSPLLQAAELVKAALTNGNEASRTSAAAAVRAVFAPGTASDLDVTLKVAVGAAYDAVLAAEAAKEAPPDKTAVTAARSRACVTASVMATITPDPACQGTPSGEELGVQMAAVRLELAKYRQSVFGRVEDSQAVKDATSALTNAQAVGAPPTPESLTVVEALGEGADAVLAGFAPVGDKPPVLFQSLGWLLLGGLALVGWRKLEIRSNQQLPGPVGVTFGKSGAPSESKEGTVATDQEAAFRTALFKNVTEPAAAPGATAATPVTDLAELVTSGGAAWLKQVIETIQAIFNAPCGYQALVDVLQPDKAEGEWRVLVRVLDVPTNAQVAVKTVRGKDETAACRAAGYWVAATILERSTRVPSWASWTGDTAEALAATDAEPDTGILERALAKAPSSGMLLHRLADQYDLVGKHAQALGLLARAITAHPGYLSARYRMAVSMGMLALDTETNWLNQPISERLRIAGEVRRACKQIGITAPDSRALADNECQPLLWKIADQLYAKLDHDCSRRALFGRLFRRSERAAVGQLLQRLNDPFGPARRGHWLVRSARLVLGTDAANKAPLRLVDLHATEGLEDLETKAADHRSWWQLNYNLGCFYARHRDVPGAIDFALGRLEAALGRPGSEQMAGTWLLADPDLAALQQLPRFKTLTESLNPKVSNDG
jgi:hypothetical protein